ncbi:thioredoxin family protein [Jeotgalibacillus sp. ET6]|uniref:thioredoxin family protein n=1 Tax=Jeotgalibacillus sp. ET6 TaxID=3037260 RepID=UPI00241828F2|nr:thioredoxin family protein [Jeotgalibacillus sp. ET6]MDG5472534.1 thioredoxin family protein [Jeotgalibacillus sp. ET6]
MRQAIEITSLQEAEDAIAGENVLLMYLSKENCSVCHALLPKIQDMMEAFPAIKFYQGDVGKIQEIAGQFSIFTVPGLLLYAEGREVLREARFVRVEELNEKLEKINAMYLAE